VVLRVAFTQDKSIKLDLCSYLPFMYFLQEKYSKAFNGFLKEGAFKRDWDTFVNRPYVRADIITLLAQCAKKRGSQKIDFADWISQFALLNRTPASSEG